MDTSLIDEVISVGDEEAFAMGGEIARIRRYFRRNFGGRAVCAAVRIAKRPENAGKRIAVIIPDTGMRYLSTALFSE